MLSARRRVRGRAGSARSRARGPPDGPREYGPRACGPPGGPREYGPSGGPRECGPSYGSDGSRGTGHPGTRIVAVTTTPRARTQ